MSNIKPIFYENLKELNKEFFPEFKEKFEDFLNSGWYILGETVKTFEENFSTFNNSNFTVGLASGLDALHLAINSLNLDKGSEIIVPSNTYIATILAIINNGHIPVMVEPDIKTYNIDPDLIVAKITKKTKAIIVVHLYGKSCEMDKICSIANEYSIPIIEDCAQAHGSSFKGKNVGNFGDFGAFSFYPTKNLGALGDAGALTMKLESNYQQIRTLRNYGSKTKYYNDLKGFNSRLDEVQAMFLNIKLKKINKITAHKRSLADLYLKNISNNFIKPIVHDDYFDVYHIFNIRHERRDLLKKHLYDNGISTEIHYPVPPNKQKALEGYFNNNYPISEEIHRTTLSLPISYATKVEDVERVCEVLNKF